MSQTPYPTLPNVTTAIRNERLPRSIIELDPSGSIILTTLTSDRGIKAEGNNLTTVTGIVTDHPSGSIILTTLTSDRGIKAEGHNLTTVTRIVALDQPGEPER